MSFQDLGNIHIYISKEYEKVCDLHWKKAFFFLFGRDDRVTALP